MKQLIRSGCTSLRLVFKSALVLAIGILFFIPDGRLAAAPLERGFAAAPSDNDSQAKKTAAYREARSKVVAAAGKYEKTPYRYGGVDRNGMDCSGLIYTSFREALAVTVPRTASALYSWVERITTDKLQPGDLVFFITGNTNAISHVGIFVGGGLFIHSASSGPVTGVMYSSLSESYWARTYAGAGRALPAANTGDSRNDTGLAANPKVSPSKPEPNRKKDSDNDDKNAHFLLGVAAAPSWGGILSEGNVVRGVAGQLRAGAEATIFGSDMIFGLEIRPEWDGTLGIFRIPVTLSWGKNDKLRFFGGPAFSFGNPVLHTSGGDRKYASGFKWFASAGVTAAPFAIKIADGQLAPYAELAWQSYFKTADKIELKPDLAAGFRLSTGLRYTWRY